jgi:cytochrome c oxidase cbb3-type subunit 3
VKPLAIAGMVFLLACGEERQTISPGASLMEGNRQTDFQPGPPTQARNVNNPYEGDEDAIADGKRLFNQFNCSGCHASGGGAIGPPLMDDQWIYGSTSANIFYTIIEGRPQGMPAFGGRIAQDQVWRIAAYVRSLSGLKKETAK